MLPNPFLTQNPPAKAQTLALSPINNNEYTEVTLTWAETPRDVCRNNAEEPATSS